MITDLFLALFLLGLLALGLRKPYLWVLAYIYVDVLSPGKIGYTIMPNLQPSLLTFIAAFGGWMMSEHKYGGKFTVRQAILTMLLIYCFFTTRSADFPVEAAEKWAWAWKSMFFAICLPFFLTTRLRIEAALVVMVLTISTIIIGAAIKILLGGGGYEAEIFLVNDNSGLYESSTLTAAAICIIPIVLWLNKYGTIFKPDMRVKLYSLGLIGACLLMPIGTEARTGLLCIALLIVLGLRDSRHKFAFAIGAFLMAAAAIPFLPESFTKRMSTIENHKSDESASNRVNAWLWTIDYAGRHPFGGGFDAYRGNKFTYKIPMKIDYGNVERIEMQEVTDVGRAYHSAVFEMLGEQGYPGLLMWLSLHGIGFWQMESIRRRWRKKMKQGGAVGEEWVAPLATSLGYAQAVFLVASLFQALAFTPFILTILGVQCALSTYSKRLDSRPVPEAPEAPSHDPNAPYPRRRRNAVGAGARAGMGTRRAALR